MNISNRISQLPKVIQDYINEFNVDHRPLMKLVCEDIKYICCDNDCGTFMKRQYIYYGYEVFCSKWCKSEYKYNQRVWLRDEKLPQFLQENHGLYDEEHVKMMQDVRPDIEYVECSNGCGVRVPRKNRNRIGTLTSYRVWFCSRWCECDCESVMKQYRRMMRKLIPST